MQHPRFDSIHDSRIRMHSGDETGTVSKSEKDKYRIPTWVGKPPEGSHLDVMKSGQVVKVKLIGRGTMKDS